MSDNGQEKQVLFEIKQLCKSFGPTKVLDHIDATIRQGEVVVIVGPSGSGKSTFLRSLNLLEMPTSGEILFEGKEITDPKSNLTTSGGRSSLSADDRTTAISTPMTTPRITAKKETT